MAGIDRVKYPSLPSNYVTIAELKERWLKEKERKEQEEKEKLESEEKEKYPVLRNHENRIVNGCAYSRGSVGKNLQKRENHSGKGWREVGLIAKEPKLKEVRMNGSVVEEGVDRARGKEKIGCFGKRGARVERDGSGDMAEVTMIDVEEEELMAVVSAGRGGKESSKGKCKWNSGNQEVEEVATVCMVEVVGESNVDREIAGGECRVGYRGKKNSWNAEQSGQKQNAGKEKVLVDVTEKVRVGGAFRAYGDKEVASVCAVEVVGENKVDREITGQNCRVGNRGKKNGGRKMGVRIGEMSDKADSVEQSGRKHNVWKEKVTVDVIERTNEKVRLSGAFHAHSDKEVASVCAVEVVGENKVDREIAGQNCGVGFRVNNNSWREVGNRVGEASNKADSVEQSGQKHNAGKEVVPVDVKERTHEKVRVRGAYRGKKNSSKQMVDRVGEVSDKADSVEQLGQECNAEKEKVSVDLKERTNEKVTVSGAFRAYSAKEAEEVATVCTVKVVEENKVDREISGKKHRVGFKGKKPSWRKIGDRVEEVSDKANSVEQSVRECNAEKEKVSVDVKERTNEKVRVKSAFGDNEEVEEVSTVCTVEEEEEIKVDGKTAGKKRRVWYRGKKHSGRKMVNRVGKVSNKADSAELSGQERNAEKEEISVDVKERANEKARVRGAFCANSDKSKDVLIDSEAGLNRTIEGDLGDLSLTDRRYGHGRSSVRVYGGKSYGSSRRYDVRKMLKQRDNSFAWIKKGESSNGNVAEIETQPKHKLEYAVLSVNQVSFLTEVASYSLISPMRLNFSLEFKQLVNSSVDGSPSLLKDGSGCTSECESGWTMYFDEFSYTSDQFNGVTGRSIYDGRGKSAYADEDLSMVSDASSGPPHNNFHEDREFCCEENGNFLYTETENTKEKQKRKMKEQSGKKHNLYLDDTASSPVSNFHKDNTGFYNDTTYMEQVAGNSGTYSKGKSVLGKHFGFLKTSVNGKASSEKSGVLKGRKRG